VNSYDSVKLLTPIEGLISFNTPCYDGKIDVETGETVYRLKQDAVKPLGLSQVEVSDRGVLLSFSAKALGERYIEGINAETVDCIVPAIRSVVDVNPESLLDATLFSIDSTNNIHPKNVQRSILSVGSIGTMNNKYRFADYGGQGQQGFVFSSRAKTVDERIIGYDKYREMMSKRKTALALGVNDFRGVLRIESNIRHKKQMREYLGFTDSYKFQDALNTNRKPNAELFEKVIGNTSDILADLQKLHRTDGMGMEHIKNIAFDRIIELHGGNWSAIEKYIRLQYRGKSNPIRVLNIVKERTALYHTRQHDSEQLLDDVLEVRELLKVA